jgi:alpha-galactosidase
MKKRSPQSISPIAVAMILFVWGPPRAAFAQNRSQEAENAAAMKWVRTSLETAYSFQYASKPSAALLRRWKQTSSSRALSDGRVELTKISLDPATGLEMRLVSTVFPDFPAVEWVMFFKNKGTADSPILENILPLDATLPMNGEANLPVIHYSKGALCSIDDFTPVDRILGAGEKLYLQPGGGRSSSEVLPFFNVDLGGAGMILGIGWSGEWAASFAREPGNSIRIQSGMAKTHLKLHPGEEIRTPRMLALFWQGEPVRGNNLLRRFLLTHHRPQPGGKPIVLPVLLGSWGGDPADKHLQTIQRIKQRELPIGLYWIDAEWFGGSPWWKNPGNWTVRKDLYPQGFKAISEPLHQAGKKLLLWFEPQRVCRGSDWASFLDRPGWLLELGEATPEYKQHNMDWKVPHEDPRWVLWESRRSQIQENDLLWNMGEPAARRFLTDWLSDRFAEFGLDWYREDFNIAPYEFWQHADTPDRQGMTEIRFIEGLYAMWDELLRRHPGLAIDNCASGGRRMDLESIGRSTALWRTDWPQDAIHRQCHTFGLLSWVPLNMSDGAVLAKGSEYEWRSAMTAGMNVKLPEQDDEESARYAKAAIEQYLSIQKFYYGDYYPLTKYSQAKDAWMAYQLDLPETGEGLIVALKRPESKEGRQTLSLKGLDAGESYEITNLDTKKTWTVAGSQLMGAGLEIELANQPDSALIQYRRIEK